MQLVYARAKFRGQTLSTALDTRHLDSTFYILSSHKISHPLSRQNLTHNLPLPPPTSHCTPRSLPVRPPHLIPSPERTGVVRFFDEHCLLVVCLCYKSICPVSHRPLDLGRGLLEVSFWELPPLRGCRNQAGIVLTCSSHCSTVWDDMVSAPVQVPLHSWACHGGERGEDFMQAGPGKTGMAE